MNVAAALRKGSTLCRRAGLDSPRLDAEVLLARCLAEDRGRLFAAAERPVTREAARRYGEMIRRRCAGEPVAYLCEEKEFFGLPFRVDPSVLVPRPETEGIVERATRLQRAFGGRRLADVGTGCGNIAVAARLCAGFEAVAATELADDALETAKRNARRLGAGIDFFHGDLLEPLLGTAWDGTTDVVCSNPPYVKQDDLASLPPEVRCEP
ncbi:MAG: N5-glutamine methyltransferase family protein, partial [Planctomycetota bacterium]